MAPNGRRIAAVAGILILLLVISSGCGVIKNLITGGESEDQPTVQTDPGLAPENIGIDDSALQDSNEIASFIEPVEITLYFADSEGNGLSPEVRTIEKVEGIARAAMSELIEGPTAGNGLLPTIPQGTSLLDINVKSDGLCIVDFSSELLGEVSGELISDELMVYSIVNTLTEFPTVERVEFRIGGEAVNSLGDNISVTAPLYANPGLVSN